MADTFLELTDTPANYTDDADKLLRVNAGETAVCFTSVGTFNALLEFIKLSDTPASYTGSAYALVAVDDTPDELVFSGLYARGGKLGIGTDDPQHDGHIQRTGIGAFFGIEAQVNAGAPHIYFQRSLASLGNVTANKKLGDILAQGYQDGAYRDSARISFWTDGTITSTVVPAEIRFETGSPLTAWLTLRHDGALEYDGDEFSINGGEIVIDSNEKGLTFAEQGSGGDIRFIRGSTRESLHLQEYYDSAWVDIFHTHIKPATGTVAAHPVYTFGASAFTWAHWYSNVSDYLEIGAWANVRVNPYYYLYLQSTKVDTGYPTGVADGLFVINTHDNKVSIYADGGWRDLATW